MEDDSPSTDAAASSQSSNSILERIPGVRTVSNTARALSVTERILLGVFILTALISGLVLLYRFNDALLVEIPKQGGIFREGVVGSPRFINPLLAISNVDQDLSALVYAGLMKAEPDGTLSPNMAESVTLSDDGITYNVILRDNLTFHDGSRVTSEDVLFTIERAQDPGLKSPKRASWEGVTVEIISDRELNFVLPQPYVPFLENLTLGILPAHLWENATPEEFSFSQFNTQPIGSGPYQVESVERNVSGIPEYYRLLPFDSYAGGAPYIREITIHFYPNEDELIEGFQMGEVDSLNSVASGAIGELVRLREDVETVSTPLPRTFAAFFNQNRAPVFRDEAVREALSVVIEKERIINEVLNGYGTIIDGPIPPQSRIKNGDEEEVTQDENATTSIGRLEAARDILKDGDWEVDEETGIWTKESDDGNLTLTFSISTSNAPELKAVGTILKEEWEKLGAQVDLKLFEQSDLTQSVIRPRDYEVLLFGSVIGRELDFFSFWHSSQRNDPGLNVALYANLTVDTALSEARTILNIEEREAAFEAFETEIATDIPAVFLYVPDFIYIVPKTLRGFAIETITVPSERFLNIEKWHLDTEEVWPFFTQQ